ncbi:XrtA/PEP-CTERM system TPR-repeat protein PrsT [Rubrivivax gelatinosus]|uniref:XrtA/PEP-CTERM system TPR-repeat protein PrsT n=1 Tax=Rubrivivax gelatinosus TaxID=28068 RepID=UPI00068015DF|nr:XrtA/PEP-CTERM system TPR-repeat protein PrsT [Rubrivivax gelatinosus]
MIPAHLRRTAIAVGLALALVILGACGGPSEAELMASAKELAAKQDLKGAAIQLKALLQKQPQNGEARFLLGRALLDGGDPVAAVVELDRAHDLKYSDDQVVPILARALLASGQAKKATDLFSQQTLADPRATAELKATVAVAYIVQGNGERCEAVLKQALSADPANSSARLLMARLTAGKGDTRDAQAQVEALLKDDPKRREAWLLKAELLWVGQGDADAGRKAFEQALVVDPRYVQAHSGLATLLLQRGQVDAFKARVAEMKKVLPGHPDTRFYEAQVALLDKDYRSARAIVQQLLKARRAGPRTLQLAATIELLDGSTLQAQRYLTEALDLAPGQTGARRLLAEAYLRAGDPDKAVSTLAPLVEGSSPDADALALTAEAYLHSGDVRKAESFFKRAVRVDPDSTKARTALALTQISGGNTGVGFSELESIASGDRASTYADLALISARVRRNEIPEALKAVDGLQQKMPDAVLPHYLRGRLLARRGDRAGARASLQKAVSIDPVYFPAVAALAGLDLLDKKPEDARGRYTALLEREPKNPRAMLALAELRYAAGAKPEEILSLLVDAVKSNPAEAAPRVALIDYHLTRQDSKGANEAAAAAIAALPDDLLVLDAVGRAQLAAGNTQQAIATFGKAAAIQPGVAQPQLRLADAFMAAKDYESARRSLHRALEVSPRLLAAQRGLVVVALNAGRPAEALEVARSVQKERPTEAAGWQMQADAQMVQRDWSGAIASMREVLKRGGPTEAANRTYELYLAAGRGGDADQFAAGWMKDHPGDVRFLFQAGVSRMVQRDLAGAEKVFRQVLALRPDDPQATNNVAWLMVQQGKPGALELAERAQRLAPTQAQAMDTLASALAAQGQLDKALDWQRKAIAAEPANSALRLGLARLLIQQGEKASARDELEKLSRLGPGFAGQAEVARLLKTL